MLRLTDKFSPLFLGAICGFSVFYFLYFFESYGIQKGLSYSGHSHLFRSISFGVLTFAYLAIFETWIKPVWKINNTWRGVAWYVALVLLGSQLIFLLFNYFWNWQEWDLRAYLLIMKEFPLLMFLPMVFFLAIKSLKKPKIQEPAYLSFQSENGKDQLKVRLADFLYANSSKNYITVVYLSNGVTQQHLIRKSLKMLEQELSSHHEITRSHRSYLVNKTNIQKIKQDKGKVHVNIGAANIPVSKQFHGAFLN
ncbi:MAG: LytTR family transcriptional regulator DNA-binding domain-containing protein [Bacteroidota bacterium]